MLVMSRIDKSGFVITGTIFDREYHTGGRVAIVAGQAPLSPAAGPKPTMVGVFEPDYSVLVPAHFMTGDAIVIINRPAYMA